MLCGEEAQWQDEEEVKTKEQQLITRYVKVVILSNLVIPSNLVIMNPFLYRIPCYNDQLAYNLFSLYSSTLPHLLDVQCSIRTCSSTLIISLLCM